MRVRKIQTFKLMAGFLLLLSLALQGTAVGAEWEPGILHIHTTWSTGSYSVEGIARKAHAAGMKIVFVSDHDMIRFEYGLFPFRDLIKVKREQDSILSRGAAAYLEEIDTVDAGYPDMLIIPALESAPFYFWEGVPWKKDFQLRAWQRHLFVVGLEDPKAIEDLPLIGNRGNRFYRWSSFLKLWPAILIFVGWKIKGIKRTEKKRLKYFVVKKKHSYSKTGLAVMVLGALALAWSFPFKVPRFDPYHGDRGVEPYQVLIDYVNEQGGMAFWAHPEGNQYKDFKAAKFVTSAYPQMLLWSRDYQGFASLYEGYRECASPGGYWDQALNEYRGGSRARPPWTIGELDFHVETEGSGKRIDEVRTYFFVDDLNKASVYEALRQGRVYASRATEEYRLLLKDFSITSEKGSGISGDELSVGGPFTVRARVVTSPAVEETVTLSLVRDGEIVGDFQGEGVVEIAVEDTLEEPDSMSYYRIDATTKYPHRLFSNPIFVRQKR